MINLLLAAVLILTVSLVFSMFGKGGGELYLPVMLSLLDVSFYTAAGVSLFLIFLQSASMTLVYHRKHRLVDWSLAVLLSLLVGLTSFLGGFFSKGVPAVHLKSAFASFLILSALLLFLNKNLAVKVGGFGAWHRRFSGGEYDVQILYVLLPVGAAAFFAGMLGISGGGLIVPIAVLLGGVPIRIAMGTNTFLVLASSSMGFLGHIAKGGIDWRLATILALCIVVGSQVGSHMHARVGERALRIGLATILLFAAAWMILRTVL